MKKQLLVAAVIFAAVSAQASKARLNALGNSEHIVDIQEVFQAEPDQALNYEAATVEFGGSGTSTTEAEGGFIRKMGDSAWSMYLGRSSTTFKALTDSLTGLSTAGGVAANTDETAVLRAAHAQANPLQLTYAGKMSDIAYGASLLYVGNKLEGFSATSGAETFSGKVEQDIMGVLLGANNGVWDVQLRQGVAGNMTTTGTAGLGSVGALATATKLEIESTGSTQLSGGYLMDSMYFYGSYNMSSATAAASNAAGTKTINNDISSNVLTLGVVNSHKKDGVDFFYGASAVLSNGEVKSKVGAGSKTETESTIVPLIVGVEAEVSSWMTLRGSLTQPLSLLSTSSSKVGTAASTGESVSDATVTALGAGFKWGKANIDAVISTGTDGNFGVDSGGDILGQASVTYNF